MDPPGKSIGNLGRHGHLCWGERFELQFDEHNRPISDPTLLIARPRNLRLNGMRIRAVSVPVATQPPLS